MSTKNERKTGIMVAGSPSLEAGPAADGGLPSGAVGLLPASPGISSAQAPPAEASSVLPDALASQIALKTLAEASQALAETENLEEALHMIAWRAAETLRVSECFIYEYDSRAEAIIPLAYYEQTPTGWDGLGESLPLAVHRTEKNVLESGIPLLEVISDPDLDPMSRKCMEKWGDKTCLSIPLLVGAKRLGLMAFYDTERERTFDEAEMALARGLGSLASQAIHSTQLVRQTAERNIRLASLLQACWAINSSLDIDDILEVVADHAVAALDCDGCTMYPAGSDQGHGPDAILHGDHRYLPLQQHLDDPDLDPVLRAAMESRGQKSRLVIPLPFGRSRLGAMVIYQTRSSRRFSNADIELVRGLATQAGLAIRNAQQYQELRRMHIGGLRAIVGALGAKEPYTHGHGARVSRYVSLLGEKLGWSADMVQRAEETGFLHDIGKLVVPDAVLLRPSPLTERDWAVMKTHPQTSRDILRPMVDEEQADAICHHHERYDGTGYPDGSKGEEIPILARAVCVADAYDAMSYQRPYRWALPYAECRAELMRGRGTQFDPEMVDAFLQVLDDLKQQREICLSVAEKAAALIDADKHERLKTREDERRPEYKEITAVLRGVLESSPEISFLHTVRRAGTRFIYVVDPQQRRDWKSHIGDEIFTTDYEMGEVLRGVKPDVNALCADEFGIWIPARAPIRDPHGKIVGLVSAVSAVKPAPRTDNDPSTLGSMASLLGEVSKRIARAEFQASTDGLTGAYNHRHLHEHLTDEVSKAMMEQTQLSVLFIDIDHFKSFNDHWGHPFGDELLRATVRIIEGQIRRNDIVARYGGDEFVAVLSDTDLSGGLQVAERIREKMTASPLVPNTNRVTVSIGIAVFPIHAASKAELIEKADSAMYEAKRLGRNRIQVYFDSPL
jgi:diguanylate cyclase (GGDEF)-like protein